MTEPLVWLITGTSSGIGRELALAALRRGDKVIATGRQRSIQQVEDLNTHGADVLELDVTASLSELKVCAEKAIAMHGRVDIVVNNAGSFIAVGALEEITPEETLEQFNVNLFGALNVARAFLPYMRARCAGTILWIGSLTGWVGGTTLGMYATTKYAIRGVSESMDAEISPLGLRSIYLEPGYFRTKLTAQGNRAPYENRIEDYREIISAMNDILLGLDGKQPGDAVKLSELIVDIMRGQGFATGRAMPRSLQIGNDCYHQVKKKLRSTLATLEEWKEVIVTTDVGP